MLKIAENAAGFDGHGEIGPSVLHDPVQASGGQDQVGASGPVAPELGAAATGNHGQTVAVCAAKGGAQVLLVFRFDHPQIVKRFHGQKRSATPAVSSGCGTYSPGLSPQRRKRGKILVGLATSWGSKAQRRRCMVSRSGSANILDIMCFFSSPTPCSPVMEPPFSMQSSRIFSERAMAAFSSPGTR